jgi:hypothetical protein
MNKHTVQVSDYQSGFSGHGCMYRIAGKQIAQNRILSICRAAPQDVTGIKVTKDDRNVFGFEMTFDFFTQEDARYLSAKHYPKHPVSCQKLSVNPDRHLQQPQ